MSCGFDSKHYKKSTDAYFECLFYWWNKIKYVYSSLVKDVVKIAQRALYGIVEFVEFTIDGGKLTDYRCVNSW